MEKTSKKPGVRTPMRIPYEEQGPLFNIFLQQTELFFHRDIFITGLLRIAKNSMQANVCSVRLLEENKLSSGVTLGQENLSNRNEVIPASIHLLDRINRKEPLVVSNLEIDKDLPTRVRNQWLKSGFKSCLAMPLFYQGGPVIGVLAVFYARAITRATVKRQKLSSLVEMFAYMLHNTVLDEDIQELRQLIKNVVEFTTDSIIVTDELGKIL